MPQVTANEANEPTHDAETIRGLQRSFPEDWRASDER
jgi:hypothetical protein